MKIYEKPEVELVLLVSEETVTSDPELGDVSNPFAQ